MGRRYDDKRWVQNPDGSFSRITDVQLVVEEKELIQEEEAEFNATRAAAELAVELGVDLSKVEGSGHNGKITKSDVESAAV